MERGVGGHITERQPADVLMSQSLEGVVGLVPEERNQERI